MITYKIINNFNLITYLKPFVTIAIFALILQMVYSQERTHKRYSVGHQKDTISITVANHDELKNYIFIPAQLSIHNINSFSSDNDSNWESPWYRVYDIYKNKIDSRINCYQGLSGKIFYKATSAEYSRDSTYLILGINNPDFMPPNFINKALIIKANSKEVVKNLIFNDDIFIKDYYWTDDSKSIILLLEQKKTKYSLQGIFLLLAGHPITLKTYYLQILNLETNDVKQLTISENIESGIAVINSH